MNRNTKKSVKKTYSEPKTKRKFNLTPLSIRLVDLKKIIKIQTNAETLHFTANTIENLRNIEFEMISCEEKFRKSLTEGKLVNYKSYIWFVPKNQNKEILKYDRIKDDLEDDCEKCDFFSSNKSNIDVSRNS